VLVHGWRMPSLVMLPLAWRLRARGYRVIRFSYPSVALSLADNAAKLGRFLLSIDAPRVHLVGHSLGGLLIVRMLQIRGFPVLGRIVLIGSPYGGSWLARRLAGNALGRRLLGKSVQHGILHERPRWEGQGDLGVIAGSFPLGVGTLFPEMPFPHDGVVALSETEVPGAAERLVVRKNHFGMLLSAEVAREVAHFLAHGRFAAHSA
jgi:pimeloyl-ACP methyl ester carboxylesterase